jgi:hypothetical protein
MNPGPGMIKAMVGRFTNPPATRKHATNGAVTAQPAAATVAVATTIKGAEAEPAPVKATTTPKAAPAKPTKPTPPSPTPAPEKKPGLIERLVYGS